MQNHLDVLEKTNNWRINILLYVAVVFIVSFPFLLSYYKIGIQTAFGSFAADSMTYMAVAIHTIEKGFITFNQSTITNGYQPLWQYLLIILQAIFNFTPRSFVSATLIFSVLIVAIGYVGMVRGVTKYWGFTTAAIMALLISPGAFALFFEPSIGHESRDAALLYSFTNWAFVNSMESATTVLGFGLLIMFILQNLANLQYSKADNAISTQIYSFFPRICLCIILFSRLDDIFIYISLALSIFIFSRGSILTRVREILIISLPGIIAVLVYMVLNMITVGTPVAASGLLKTGIAFSENFNQLLKVMYHFDATKASRMIPMIVSMIAGGLGSIFLIKSLLDNSPNLLDKNRFLVIYLLLPLAGYVFFKSLFHFTLVSLWHQGWWYYTGQIFVFNFLIGIGVCRLLTSNNLLVWPALGLLSIVCVVQMIDAGNRLGHLNGYSLKFYKLWSNREEINKELKAIDQDMKLIDSTDGVYGFILDIPSELATGLTMSTKDERADVAEKGTVPALYERGYTVVPLMVNDKWSGHYVSTATLDKLGFEYTEIYHDLESDAKFYKLNKQNSD